MILAFFNYSGMIATTVLAIALLIMDLKQRQARLDLQKKDVDGRDIQCEDALRTLARP